MSDSGRSPRSCSVPKTDLAVFCIDDDKDVLLIVQIALQLDKRITATCVSNAHDALLKLIEPTYKPDCILLDRAMPDVDGRLLMGEIRGIPHHRMTPVIFLTAHVTERDRNDYSTLGACSMIRKPFDPISLAREVRQMVGVMVPSIALSTPNNGHLERSLGPRNVRRQNDAT